MAMTARIADGDRDHQPVRVRGRRRPPATITRPMGAAMTASSPSHRNAAGSRARSWRAERREVEAGAAAQRRDPVGDHQHDADRRAAPTDDVGHRDEQPADAVLAAAAGVGWRVVDRGRARRSCERPQQHLDGRVDQDDDEQQRR